jgi:serine/threonine-protein kinase
MEVNPQRHAPTSIRFYSFGSFCLDGTCLVLYDHGEPVVLAPRFVRALLLFVQNRGVDLDKNYLMDQLWPDTAVEENNLTVIISGLRKAFGDVRHKYIVTIPGRGYRFVADVAETSEQPALMDSTATALPESPNQTKRLLLFFQRFDFFRKEMIWFAAGVVFILTFLVAWGLKGWITAKANTVHTLAVLPFESVGFGSDDEYLGLGMADALAARLRNDRHIIVRPVEDVLPYRNQAYDPQSTGHVLEVNAILTGTVRKAGDQMDVSVRLLRTSDSGVLWSQDFTGEIKQILAMQDRIADRAASALTLNIRKEVKEKSTQQYSQNSEAYQLYLHGQYLLTQRSRLGADADLNQAVEYFQQALGKDARFAEAYAALATAYNRLSFYIPAENSLAKAEGAAEKALSIDGNLAEAYRALAVAKQTYDWDFKAADAAYRRAIELNSEDPVTHRWYVDELLAVGRNQEALNEWNKARELDPFSSIYDTLGHVYFYSRRYREAFLELQGKQDVDSDAFWMLAWLYRFHREDLGDAHAPRPSVSVKTKSLPSICELAYVNTAKTTRTSLESCFKSLQKGATASEISPYNMALLYTGLKDNDTAFYWLNRARQAHTWDLMYAKVDPRLDELRSDSRFNTLLHSMGLRP